MKEISWEMKSLVFVVLLALASSYHVQNEYPFVYDTHNTGSQSPLIIMPPQPFRPAPSQRRSFRPSTSAPRRIPIQQASIPFTPAPQTILFPPSVPSHPYSSQLYYPVPALPAPQPSRPAPVLPAPILPAQPFRPAPILPAPQPSLPPRHSTNRVLVHDTRNDRSYHFSWLHNNQKYSWEEANLYCNRLGQGFQAVSIQDQGENNFITNIINQYSIQYIWTSGNRLYSHDWTWGDGSLITYFDWSRTGGNGQPQPDNRENRNEKCLAVLNNVYQDGIKWHDIACHHVKHVICETHKQMH